MRGSACIWDDRVSGRWDQRDAALTGVPLLVSSRHDRILDPAASKKAWDQRCALGRFKCNPSSVPSPSEISGATKFVPRAIATAFAFPIFVSVLGTSVRITQLGLTGTCDRKRIAASV